MLSPETIVAEIRKWRQRDPQPLRVFWVWVAAADRDEFGRGLTARRGTLALVPHVSRTVGFVHPDAVMRDVLQVLESVRGEVEALREAAEEQGGVDLVVVSRTKLGLADTSSPITLPQWFPVQQGNATVRIEDLTWTAAVALDDTASELDELRRILHELDTALLRRLQASRQYDPHLTRSLWDLVLKGSDEGAGEEAVEKALRGIGETLEAIRNPTSFRPSARHRPTVIGRLWAHANRTSPDALPRAAKALAGALGPMDVGDEVSLAAVLNRPTNPIPDTRERWAFALIVALRTACQLVTAAAHADDYPRFPEVLLRSTSEDLRRFLDRAVEKLRQAPVS